jgi:hypothetical protein
MRYGSVVDGKCGHVPSLVISAAGEDPLSVVTVW